MLILIAIILALTAVYQPMEIRLSVVVGYDSITTKGQYEN
jgi:hypothetical protein